MHHTKIMIADDGDSIVIGSANFEPISFTYSGELVINLTDIGPKTKTRMLNYFDNTYF